MHEKQNLNFDKHDWTAFWLFFAFIAVVVLEKIFAQ